MPGIQLKLHLVLAFRCRDQDLFPPNGYTAAMMRGHLEPQPIFALPENPFVQTSTPSRPFIPTPCDYLVPFLQSGSAISSKTPWSTSEHASRAAISSSANDSSTTRSTPSRATTAGRLRYTSSIP